MNTVLDIDQDGTVTCLWNEDLPLAEFGRLHPTRASNVEFNVESQQWEVRLESEPDRVAFTHPSRATCIAWEVHTINQQLLNR